MREGTAIGAIAFARRRPGTFQQQEIDLAADLRRSGRHRDREVRLFNETQEALERQTATANILRVISNSPGDVQPVFETVAEHAARICGAQIVESW